MNSRYTPTLNRCALNKKKGDFSKEKKYFSKFMIHYHFFVKNPFFSQYGALSRHNGIEDTFDLF